MHTAAHQVERILVLVIAFIAILFIFPRLSDGRSDRRSEAFTFTQNVDAESGADNSPPGIDRRTNSIYSGTEFITDTTGSAIEPAWSAGSQGMVSGHVSDVLEQTADWAGPSDIPKSGSRWVAPAWEPDKNDPVDYENDSRMLYNKCGVSCCSEQFPTPFQGKPDPDMYDKNGKRKYPTSSYTCLSDTGGSGCLCVTDRQLNDM